MEEDRAFEDGPLAGGHEDARPLAAELWCAALWEYGGASGDADWRPRARGTVAEAAGGMELPAGRTTGEEEVAMDGQRESFWAYDGDHDDFEDEDLVERDEFGVEEFVRLRRRVLHAGLPLPLRVPHRRDGGGVPRGSGGGRRTVRAVRAKLP